MTNRDTLSEMPERAISVRLDEEARAALDELLGLGLTQSDAIRKALIEAAARRRRPRMSLAAEAMMLAADEEDRRLKAELLEFMGEVSDSG